MASEGDWLWAIDSPLPATLRVGAGSAIFVSGWIFHRRATVSAVALRLGDEVHDVATHSMPRLDVYVAVAEPGDEPPTTAYRSGFWAVLPVHGVAESIELPLSLLAVNRAGERFETPLSPMHVRPAAVDGPAAPEPGLVVVCMTTYNPDLELFARQIASLRAQTHASWRCIVCDDGSDPGAYAAIRAALRGDDRFELHRNDERLGFYFNFERVLERVPAEAEAVALCDQDDDWRPEKLATLLAALRDGHALVYSDQRIVDPRGEVLAPTYWSTRPNQWTDLGELVVSNTVTGAASLVRRDLLDRALPFPPRVAGAYHDHWLALVALACGTIGYVDEPLGDYVQHAGQVVGHAAGRDDAAAPVAPAPPAPRPGRELELLTRGQYAYFANVVPAQFKAVALLERCGSCLQPEQRDVLTALAEGDATRRGVLAHVRTLGAIRGKNDGEPFAALTGMAWRRWSRWRTRSLRAPFADQRHNLDARPSYVDYGPERDPFERGAAASAAGRRRRPWRTK